MAIICPNFSNEQIKTDFDKLKGMVGEDLAYSLYSKNEGVFPWDTDNYKKIQEVYNLPEEKTMELYAFINSNQFNKWLDGASFNLDEEGNITNKVGDTRKLYNPDTNEVIEVGEAPRLEDGRLANTVESIIGRLAKTTTEFTEEQEGIRVMRSKVKVGDKERYPREVEGEIKTVKYRVHDIIDRYYKRLPFKQGMSKKYENYAKYGTLIDDYRNVITEMILNDEKVTQDKVVEKVKNNLSTITGFENEDNGFYNITPDEFKELVKTQKDLLKRIDDTQKRIDPNGEYYVLTQQILYDENKDIAGTTDLTVIYSNGDASVYDYKLIFSFKETTQGKSIQPYKMGAYEIQMQQYMNILSEQYGVNGFVENRILPMEGTFTKYDPKLGRRVFSLRSTYKGKDYAEHLEEIPLFDELTTNEQTNEQLDKMFKLRELLKSKNAKKFNKDIQEKINRLDKNIKKLQNNLGPYWMLQEIEGVLKDFDERKVYGLDYDEINEFRGYLTTYQGYLSTSLEELIRNVENESEREKKELQARRINELVEKALDEISNLEKTELFKDTNLDPNKSDKAPGFLKTLFSGLGDFSRNQFRMLYNIIQKNEAQVHLRIQEDIKIIEDATKKLREAGKKNGKSLQDYFNMLFDSKTGNLVTRFSGKYTEEKNKAINKQDLNWFLENTNITRKNGKLTYKDAESLKRFNDYKELQFKKIDGYVGDNKYKELKKEEWLQENDISVNPDAVFNSLPNKKFIRLNMNENNKDRFETDSWKKIVENEALLEYYNMYVGFNKKFADLTGEDIRENFIPNVHKSIMDAAFKSGIPNFTALKSSLKDSFRVQEHENVNVMIDPTTGKPIMHIPYLFTDPLLTNLSNKEIKEIKSALNAEDPNYKDNLNKAIRDAQVKKSVESKSKDLTKSLILFAQSSYTNYFYTQSEAMAKSVYNSLKTAPTEITDQTGKKVIDKLNKRVRKFLGVSADEISTLEKFINYYWYGQSIQNKDYLFKNQNFKNTQDGKEKLLSTTKMVRGAMKYMAIKDLGLSPIVGVGSAIGTMSNLYSKASEGGYFTTKQVNSTIRGLIRGDEKAKAIVQYLNPYGRPAAFEQARKLSASKATDLFNADTFFVMLKKPDELFDRISLVSIMKNYAYENGKIIRIDRAKNPDTKSLYESAELSEDKGLIIPGVTDNIDGYTRIRKLQVGAMSSLKGSVSYDNARTSAMNIWVVALMQYKNWMPGLIKERFGSIKYDENLEDFDVGRFRVMFGEFSGGLVNKLTAFKDTLIETIPLLKYNRYNRGNKKAFAENMFNKLMEQHPEYQGKITLEEFIDLRKRKLMGMAKELRILMSLYLVIMTLKLTAGDEDEDPVMDFLADNAYRFTYRGMLEISFFLDPGSFLQIARKPLPIIGVLDTMKKALVNTYDEGTDLITGEEDRRDRTDKWHYTSKLLPGNRFITDWMDFSNYIKR